MKITRSAFGYLEGDDARFAQCGSCAFGKDTCAVMSDEKVSPSIGSCIFYIKGAPVRERNIAALSRQQTGYVERQVRCENCRFFGQGHCGLYRVLNKSQGAVFDLEEKVDRHACCNAQTPR